MRRALIWEIKAWFKLLSWQLPDGIEKITKNGIIFFEIWTGIQIAKQGSYSLDSFLFGVYYSLTNVQYEGIKLSYEIHTQHLVSRIPDTVIRM